MEASIANHFQVLGCSIHDYAVAKRHRFHKSRMGAADARRFYKEIGIGSQLAVSFVEKIAREYDPGITLGTSLQGCNVCFGIGCISHDNAVEIGVQTSEGFYQMVGTVLWYKTPDEQDIATSSQPKTL
jgi:hypothetical protein